LSLRGAQLRDACYGPRHTTCCTRRAQGHDPDAARFLIKPDDPARSLTRLISQEKVTTLKDIVKAAPAGSEATCFHTILAGSGHLQVIVL
jgi:hypothetical protein